MRARAWLRAGLILLTVIQLVTSGWQLLLPLSFYHDVPTVAWQPPFNEHLVRDLGAMGLALTVVLAAAAIAMERRLIITALAAYLAWAMPHLAFHAAHVAAPPSLPWAVALIVALTFELLLPIVLMILAITRSPAAIRGTRT